MKPSFRRPYLQVKLQNSISVRGLYNTGADISCISLKVFRQLPPQLRPKKLEEGNFPKFKSAGGQIMPVHGKYQFKAQIGTKTIQHEFYVIPELNELLILGIDFIQQHQLWYCPKNRSFAWEGQPNWGAGHLKVCSAVTIPPLSVAFVKVAVRTEGGAPPGEGNLCLANIVSAQHPLVTGGPYLVSPDALGQVTVAVKNCAPVELELSRNNFIGNLENITGCETRELNPAYVQAVARTTNNQSTEKLTTEKRQFIEKTIHLNMPEQFRKQYLKVILKNHQAVSRDKFDLGRTDTLMHEIALKIEEPIYVKQFKIPDAHRQEVERHVLEWLKLGVIQPARSQYNSPIFPGMKKRWRGKISARLSCIEQSILHRQVLYERCE